MKSTLPTSTNDIHVHDNGNSTCSMSYYPILFIRWVHPEGLSIYIVDLKYHDTGADRGFQVRGVAHKVRRAEGGAKIVGVFRVKNHDFTPKSHIFFTILGGTRAGCDLTPWICPCDIL